MSRILINAPLQIVWKPYETKARINLRESKNFFPSHAKVTTPAADVTMDLSHAQDILEKSRYDYDRTS